MKKLILFSLVVLVSTISFAQMNSGARKRGQTDTSKHIMYTCPMHPEVILSKPGKCPKCGMTLVQKKAIATKTYTCPMHSDVVSDKPGKCPKCGMTLVEKKQVHTDQMKMK
jgi:predicted nucleic-acid-binding Zn-ribbon protein